MFTLSITSLILTSIIIWFYNHYINDPKKEKLYLYLNQGISETKLYIFTFLLNLLVIIIGQKLLEWIY